MQLASLFPAVPQLVKSTEDPQPKHGLLVHPRYAMHASDSDTKRETVQLSRCIRSKPERVKTTKLKRPSELRIYAEIILAGTSARHSNAPVRFAVVRLRLRRRKNVLCWPATKHFWVWSQSNLNTWSDGPKPNSKLP